MIRRYNPNHFLYGMEKVKNKKGEFGGVYRYDEGIKMKILGVCLKKERYAMKKSHLKKLSTVS